MSDGVRQVLAALRSADGQPRSGEALSTELGVSRAQVWKHVSTLRRRGYGIEGEPGGGYRLAELPDRLYPDELRIGREHRWLAHEIEHHDEVDSTNRVAMERGRSGARHGFTVVAEGQTAGRGRLGRSFHSPAHQNLYASIVLRPEVLVSEASTLILVAGVAVADAIASVVGDDDAVTIKWPNDVQLGGLKTSGILLELAAEETRVDFVVMGIGVNLNVDRDDFPQEFRDLATSLRSHLGAPVDRLAFTRRLFDTLEKALDEHARGGFDALRPRFDQRFRMPGQRVEVRGVGSGEEHLIRGVVRGLAPDGALEVEDDAGQRKRVLAGDVTIAKPRRAEAGAPATEPDQEECAC
jgi:BirA family biotin operon repressor/biotin-[acetyl-CoA-carboxylase] ligase